MTIFLWRHWPRHQKYRILSSYRHLGVLAELGVFYSASFSDEGERGDIMLTSLHGFFAWTSSFFNWLELSHTTWSVTTKDYGLDDESSAPFSISLVVKRATV